ncbi:hypothetical protein SAMN04489761_2652 [Tenacibaculum sp. MAR_2009_124]|uniref:hypothetical protein n=1 Tax=Tenacibaculum sp. MAR_2009_124 TaxID=1250059 RepID=UPI00089D7B8D|nr:hypothetical protein [Tenacibaculum sp. MAR_2009_124]SEC31409.1 hypothetical protein SAMN04489761_2652 [Tenacibaculum sp. MAR_2009_124]
MLRPIGPYVEYVINYDYIAKVLCINKDKPEMSCNGKCQLMDKLQKQQEDDYQSLRISMEEYPIGFISILDIQANQLFSSNLKKYFKYDGNYTYLRIQEVFHPPTV